MDYFSKFYSATLSAGAGQSYFTQEKNKITKGRIYYPLFAGGTYNYSLLYANILDSTFADGSFSRKNMIMPRWKIHSLSLRVCSFPDDETGKKTEVTFGTKTEKEVNPGEIFYSDPVKIMARKGDYLCVETEFSGEVLPCHKESLLPAFTLRNKKFIPDINQPFPSGVFSDRPVKRRIAFLGDSITQGIGVGYNNMNFWVSRLSEMLGEENAYWNLGLGYGRCDDAAGGGSWLYKAQQAQYVFVCFGVNDLCQGFSGAELIKNLKILVSELHRTHCKVLVQTVPPGDYSDEIQMQWLKVNAFIKDNRELKADMIFDNVPFLTKKGGRPSETLINNVHPDENLSKIWAEALYPCSQSFIKK